MNKFAKLAVCVSVCEFVGIASTPFTIAAIGGWYQTLNKPFFSPPNWIFGPVWIILYFLMGVSAFLVWEKGLKKIRVKITLYYFLAQLVLNFVWSFLFFGLHSPILGLIDIVLLWILIVLTIVKFQEVSKTASYLLLPYILWVSFAAILNFSIVIIN